MITKITYDVIFDKNETGSERIEEAAFIQEYGELDRFLVEVLSPVDESLDTGNLQERSDMNGEGTVPAHKTKVKQLLRRQKHDLTKNKNGGTQKYQPAKTITSGKIIGDRYEIKTLVGSGGYGTVYKGLDQQLNRFVAIKIVERKPLDNYQDKERFLREGQILARMNHPHIVQIYDIGEEHDYFFIIMEYIEGDNLKAFIKTNAAGLKISKLLPMMMQICDALAAIHSKGVLHRDIKPSNIMIDTEGNPKLMDFGISKSNATDLKNQPTLTGEGSFLGTAEFMAPEQFTKPGQVTSSSDVYSLGCTLYKLITGRNPIPGKTFLELHKNHLELEPTPIRDITKEVPASLCDIIHKMMAKNPKKRYQDGTAVKNVLCEIKKKRIPGFIKLFGVSLIVLFGITLLAKVFKPKADGWFPKPRIIAVIPFAEKASQNSFVSTEFTKLLKSHYHFYNTVERGDIFKAMEELKLNKSDLVSKEDSIRIGKLVGAHIFIMFEVRHLKGEEVIYPKVFDVETLLLLGLTKIPPAVLEDYESDNTKLKLSLDEIMKGVADELVYRSYLGSIKNNEAHLEHGQLYGASPGMKLRVLDRKEKAVGLLEVTIAEKNVANAKVISGSDIIKEGMRVEEVK